MIEDKRVNIIEQAHVTIQDSHDQQQTPAEQILAAIWQGLLGIDQIDIHENFFELGGDSFTLINMFTQATQKGLHLTPEQIFAYQTIAELAAAATMTSGVQAEQDLVLGWVPLSINQHWFLNVRNTANPHYYNSVLFWETPHHLERDLFEETIWHLLNHHDALRLRFTHAILDWQQYIVDPDAMQVPITWLDISELPVVEQKIAIERIATQLQSSLNICDGPLWQVAYIDLGLQQSGYLLWIVHHLIFDTFSKKLFLEDFESIYRQLKNQQEIHLPLKTSSVKQFSEKLRAYTESSVLHQEFDHYWSKLPWNKLEQLPVDFDKANSFGRVETSRYVEVSLSIAETNTLFEQILSVNIQILDVLLASLASAFLSWTGSPLRYVAVVDHGRFPIFDDIDLSRTIGWIAFHRDILLNTEDARTVDEILPRVQRQLKEMPQRGIGYSLLRYFCTDIGLLEKLSSIPFPEREIVLDYTGQVAQNTNIDYIACPTRSYLDVSQDDPATVSGTTFLGTPPGYPGSSQERHEQRDAKLFCAGMILKDQLHLRWEYSSSTYVHTTVENLAQEQLEAIRKIIASHGN